MQYYTVSFRTFGCKLNQAETAAIVQEFEDRGYDVVSWNRSADVFVLNTCTVTGRSDAKCRRAIRHAIKLNPETTVIVVGCFSQVAVEEVCRISGVDYILGTQNKVFIFDHFPGPGKLSEPMCFVTPVDELKKAVSRTGDYRDHTRAFLKIQDGCDSRCGYCIVPFARGPSRSVAFEDVVLQAETLVGKGHKEIVLTGVHVGMYGKDLEAGSLLPALLHRLCQVDGLERLRLSSLDPEDVTEELIECVVNSERICRHFHMPLQSGSNQILTAMNRQYTAEIFREKVEMIVKMLGRVGLGTDIIAGFPGETDGLFEETFQFVVELPFTYVHVFPFSPRKGTEAMSAPNQVEPRIRMERARKLRDLGKRKKEQFLKKWEGEVAEVLLEGRNLSGWMGGFTSEYIRIEVPYEDLLRNQLVSVHIEKMRRSTLRGEVILS